MATVTAHLSSGARRCTAPILLAAAALLAGASAPNRGVDAEQFEGRAPTPIELTPGVEAAFPRESYRPGARASLVIFNRARGLMIQIFHSGPEHTPTKGHNEMHGRPVTRLAAIGSSGGRLAVSVRIGDWPGGVYFAKLTAADGRIGFAPFVLRPRRLGTSRVAVVLPTMTWQAYNIRDDDGDGKGDSWYADWNHHTARLGRPFLNRGVPFNFRRYDLPFLHWLAWTGRRVDYLADADLDAVATGDALARAYDLIVFPGHHEYVTTHEYDVVQRYRDLGGNLAFLSANNFFWRIVKRGDVMTRTQEWRDLGRPESSLIGVQYRGNDDGRQRAAWIVRDANAARWLFAGTGLTDGSTFGSGGIEIDSTSPSAPAGVRVLAEIPDLFGPGFTAQMTYYETSAGAKVFAAGAFNFARTVSADPLVTRLVANLWRHLSQS